MDRISLFCHNFSTTWATPWQRRSKCSPSRSDGPCEPRRADLQPLLSTMKLLVECAADLTTTLSHVYTHLDLQRPVNWSEAHTLHSSAGHLTPLGVGICPVCCTYELFQIGWLTLLRGRRWMIQGLKRLKLSLRLVVAIQMPVYITTVAEPMVRLDCCG